MCNIPDNYDIWVQKDQELEEEWLAGQKCAWCGEYIGDTFYDISGDLVCEKCIDGCRRYA